MSTGRDLLPWWDQVDWMHDPALAYLKGLQDGAALAAVEADTRAQQQWVTALAYALDGRTDGDLRTAMRGHLRQLAKAARRADADRADRE